MFQDIPIGIFQISIGTEVIIEISCMNIKSIYITTRKKNHSLNEDSLRGRIKKFQD